MSAIRLATRKSALALWQARAVAMRLEAMHPGIDVVLVEITTLGDAVQDRRLDELSSVGVFTKEVDQAVLQGRADAAVHSLKDQLTELDPELLLAMVLPRGPVEDVWVARDGKSGLKELPSGARVATGSLRRVAQLARRRPDLHAIAIRGNVDGRLAQLESGAADALILARAGLDRLGLGARITAVLAESDFRPAVSQGIVGVTARRDDARTLALLRAATDEPTELAARAERAFLRELRGGCNVPAGISTRLERGMIRLEGRVLGVRGYPCIEDVMVGPEAEPELCGRTLARRLIDEGAGELIASLRA